MLKPLPELCGLQTLALLRSCGDVSWIWVHIWLPSLHAPVSIYNSKPAKKTALWTLVKCREFHAVVLGWWGTAHFAWFQCCTVTHCSKLAPGSLTEIADLRRSFNKHDISTGGSQTWVSCVVWGCGELSFCPSHPLLQKFLWNIAYFALPLVFQPKQIQILACVPPSFSTGWTKGRTLVPNRKMADTD